MQNKKYLSMLGFARRAGKVSMGHDMALNSLKKGKSKLLVFSSDISLRLVNEFERAKETFSPETPCVKIEETIDEIHSALGYKAGVISINDTNFANRIYQLINE